MLCKIIYYICINQNGGKRPLYFGFILISSGIDNIIFKVNIIVFKGYIFVYVFVHMFILLLTITRLELYSCWRAHEDSVLTGPTPFWIFCSPRLTPCIIHHNQPRLQNMLKRSSRPRRKRPALSWAHIYPKTKHRYLRACGVFRSAATTLRHPAKIQSLTLFARYFCGPTRTRTSNCGFGDRRFTIETIGPYL